VCVCVGQFEALCPGGYGYVREARGDGTEGSCAFIVSLTT